MYSLEILQQCYKRAKTKGQKVLGANSNVCRSYMGKTDRRVSFCLSPSVILNKVKGRKFRGEKR